MTRKLTSRDPKYRRQRHAKGDRAFVELNGQRIYLGEYGTRVSRQRYHQVLAEWNANGRELRVPPEELTVIELIARFWVHADRYYRKPNGTATSTLGKYRSVLRPMKALYGPTKAIDFGPRSLKAVRSRMVDLGWCRGTINQAVHMIRGVFRWAVAEELIPVGVHHALQTVSALKRGRCNAQDHSPVKPVPVPFVDAVQPYVSRQVWAIIQLQMTTAARAGELVIMRPIDLDMTGRIWIYSPSSHKTEHHDRPRIIYIGPRGQQVLQPFLAGRPVDAHMFSPAEAEAERLQARHAARRTPLSCGNRPGSNRSRAPRVAAGPCYTVNTYRRAIERACDQAFPPPASVTGQRDAERRTAELAEWRRDHRWTPHRLRHTAATAIRKEFGLEAAQLMLGHTRADVTQVYAEVNQQRAVEVASQIG